MFASLSVDPSKLFQIVPSSKSNAFLLLKKISIRNLSLLPTYETILSNEIKNQNMDSQNLIPITDYLLKDSHLFLISESLSSLSLNEFLKKDPQLSHNQIIQIISSVANGIEEMKKSNMASIHGNLNKNNIFVVADIDEQLICKLTDYHKIIKITCSFHNSYSIAPELLEKKAGFLADNLNFDFQKAYPKADVWSLGWLVYELYFGKELWDYSDINTMLKFITSVDNSSFFEGKQLPEETLDFLKRSLVYSPEKRMSWEDVLTHPLLNRLGQNEKIEVIPIDLSKVELFLRKEEIYCKYLIDVKGLEKLNISQVLINGYSNEFNLLNKNYDFDIFDYFSLFSDDNSFRPYEGKVCFRAFDKKNQKNFILRIFQIDVETPDFFNILKDCCFEQLISKSQKQLGLKILTLYDVFVNVYEGFESYRSFLVLVHDNVDFFLLDLLEAISSEKLDLSFSQKLFIFLSICKEILSLKSCNFNKIQAIHAQNIAFCKDKISNKLVIKLSFFNDVNSKNNEPNLVSPSLKLFENKVFEQRWKGVVYYLGGFFLEILTKKRFLLKTKAMSLIKEQGIHADIIKIIESMMADEIEERMGLEEVVKKIEEFSKDNNEGEKDLEFLKGFTKIKSQKGEEKMLINNFASIYENLFYFNKARISYEMLLINEQKTEDMINLMCKIAFNFYLLLDYEKCNGMCYKALTLIKSDKVKSDKIEFQVTKYMLNLMNGNSLISLNLPDKALNYLETAWKLAEQIRVVNPLAQLVCVKYLCDNYKALGKLNKALSLNEKSLELLKKQKEENYIKRKFNLEFLLSFSQTYLMMGNHSKAIEFCNDALIFMEKNFNESHPYLKQCYVSLGNLNFLQGFYDKAVNNFEFALNINKKIFPADHESFIDLNYDLATVYSKTDSNPLQYLKYFEEAYELFQKNSYIHKTLKEKKEQFSLIHSSIGRVYYTMGKYDKAVEFFQKALNLDKELFPDNDNLRLAELYLSLGTSFNCLSNYESALKNCQESLKIAEKLLPETDEKIIEILFDLGDICNNLKKLEEGVGYYEKIIKIYEKNKKLSNESKIFEVFLALGNLHMSLGNIDQALKALLLAQQKYKNLYKGDYNDPVILNILNSIAVVYTNSNNLEKAIKTYSESLEISKKHFNKEEKIIIDTTIGLAISYFNSEEYEKAAKSFKEALELKEKNNEKGANVGDLCSNLGYAMKSLQNIVEAKKYFQKAVEYYEEALPKNHKDLLTAIETLKSFS